MSGALILVGTPIGNLGDLSPRAVEALAEADLVCCEDTRRTGRLLERAEVRGARLMRVDEHSERGAVAEVCELLAAGANVALVTDAGMPTVCDPGERLVAACVAAGHEVRIVPGPSAAVAALAVSGLPTGRYAFEGFLPRKGRARAERLAEIARERRTVVLFESPHRLRSCLADLAAVCGARRRAAVAREMTKLHEEMVRGCLSDLCAWAEGTTVRGEVVVVLEGAPDDEAPPVTDDQLRVEAAALMDGGMSRRDASAEVAAVFGVSRRRVYNLVMLAQD